MGVNPAWITAGVAVAGFLGNLGWTMINLRIENKLITRIDELKDWADARYMRLPDPPVPAKQVRVAA